MLGRILHKRRRRSPGSPGGGGGGPDSGTFTDLVLAGTAIAEPPLTRGNRYNPGIPVSSIASGINWRNSASSSEQVYANRFLAVGPEYLEAGTVITAARLSAKGGSAQGRYRVFVFADNGIATRDSTDPLADGARPSTYIGGSAEQVIAVNAPETKVSVPMNVTIPTSGMYWRVILPRDSNSIQLLTFEGGTTSARVRSGTVTYVASGSPGNFPSSGLSTNDRIDISFHWELLPPPPARPAITVQPGTARQIIITWSKIAGATHYVLERKKGTGSFAPIAVLDSDKVSYIDQDKQAGVPYSYQLTAYRENSPSLPSAAATATPTGSYSGITLFLPAQLSDSVRVDNQTRGAHGKLHNKPTGVYQGVRYKRSGFEWGQFYTSSSPSSFSGTVLTNWLNNTLQSNERAWIRFRCGYNDGGNQLPSFITNYDIVDGGYYPVWNDTYNHNLLLDWIARLGQAFGNDPRIFLMDMGIFNRYGEWGGGAGNATRQVQLDIIDAICAAFPNTYLVMSLPEDTAVLLHALGKVRPDGARHVVAVRQDTLGDIASPYMWSQFYGDRSERARDIIWYDWGFGRFVEHKGDFRTTTDQTKWLMAREDTRDLMIGWIHDVNLGNYDNIGSTNQGYVLDSVHMAGWRFAFEALAFPSSTAAGATHVAAAKWRNTGNGRMFESRRPVYQLRDGGGAVAWSHESSYDLSKLRPSAISFTHEDSITIGNLDTGNYTLTVEVPALSARAPALNLALNTPKIGSSYVLGTVTITA